MSLHQLTAKMSIYSTFSLILDIQQFLFVFICYCSKDLLFFVFGLGMGAGKICCFGQRLGWGFWGWD
jgi:hypothetical protein